MPTRKKNHPSFSLQRLEEGNTSPLIRRNHDLIVKMKIECHREQQRSSSWTKGMEFKPSPEVQIKRSYKRYGSFKAVSREPCSATLQRQFIFGDLRRTIQDYNDHRRNNSIKYRIEYLPKPFKINDSYKKDSF